MGSIIETLNQDGWWHGQDGRPYRLLDLDTEHARAILAMLERRAPDLVRHAWWREWMSLYRADATLEERNAFRERTSREVADDPRAWLDRRPLVVALRHLLRLRDSVDGEVIGDALPVTRGELTP